MQATESFIRAFGYVVVHWKYPKGHVLLIDADTVAPCVTVYSSGNADVYNTDGSKQCELFAGRYNRRDPLVSGVVNVVTTEERTALCYTPWLNEGKEEPHIKDFWLGDGESTSLTKGSKIILGAGELSINGKDYGPKTQIKVSSDSVIVTAKGNCCGFEFV